jgi:NitT/TauT family transport system permease protein/taurine transport system permease protein
LRIGFAQAWRALVAAEMIGASQGIGWMVAMGGQVGNSAQVLLGIALIGLTAWLMESLVFRRIERRYEGWRGQ